MSVKTKWITPFLKQCFVTAGVSINMGASGLVYGFAAGLLDQLKRPESTIPVDDSSLSWIASIPAFSMFSGNVLVIPIVNKYGTRSANLISIALLIVTWICIVCTTNIHLLFFARTLQGISLGMSTNFSSFLIGEYTSPNNRGAFLMTISLSICFAVLLVHTLGLHLRWQTVAIICAVIAFVDLLIVFYSPESPTWLATQGKYEECRKVFRWLRGEDEEDELRKMIEATVIIRETKEEARIADSFVRKLQKRITYVNTTVQKKEFYKPLIIMIHIYVISLVGGVNIMVAYAVEWFRRVVGDHENIPLLVVTLGVQRLITNIIAIYIVKIVKRRKLLLTTVSMNIIAFIAIAAYSYAKENNYLPFDHPIIGIFLTHILMFSVATGSQSLSFIIGGEVFALQYKKLASGISMIAYSASIFFVIKSFPYCLNNIGIYGTCIMNALILSSCLSVVWFMLPETKDRTLQDIEEEFRGRRLAPLELKSVQSLTSWKPTD